MDSIKVLTPAEYPSALREIPEPPKMLSIIGELPPEDALWLAVVGSRRFTSYGKEVCEKIIGELSGQNIVIVSGLALGIDAIAHHAALATGLTTVAIPGSGLGEAVLYPRTHLTLARHIVEKGGALLSEFPNDFRATPFSFPQRNRLMAGITRGTLIIEAGEKSGTLITARLALDYNRDVFVVPASIFSRNSAGSNRLLRQGAAPVTCGADILEQWGIVENEKCKFQNAKLLEECSDEEKKILSLLNEPLPRDEIIRTLGMPVHEASALLSAMEIKGLIKESMGEIRLSI
ncbi:MAG: DNA-protecting protein DprA [Parcubacteria group bacterium]|nr:DNA-protecting protein DprA [Parcubacteria group bacterium]